MWVSGGCVGEEAGWRGGPGEESRVGGWVLGALAEGAGWVGGGSRWACYGACAWAGMCYGPRRRHGSGWKKGGSRRAPGSAVATTATNTHTVGLSHKDLWIH